MSNPPFDSTPSESSTSPGGQPSHLPPPEGGEDFLGLEQLLGGGPVEMQAAAPRPLLPEVSGEHGEAEIVHLMGAMVAPQVMDESTEDILDVALDSEPIDESADFLADEDVVADMAPEPVSRRTPTRSQMSLVLGSLLCIWSVSQWDPSAGTTAPILPTAMVAEASVVTPPSTPILQPPVSAVLEVSVAPVAPVAMETSVRPVAVVAPLRARLTALLRMAASMPSAPAPRAVPGTMTGALPSNAPLARPHRGLRSWRASLDLILAQSVGAQYLQMGNVLLGGGWSPMGSKPIVLNLNDHAPEGLGLLSSPALELPTSPRPSSPLGVQVASVFGDSNQAANLMMPTAVPSQNEQPTTELERGLTPVAQGNRWTRPEIPEGAIAQASRLLTPGVGIVRATLHGGEVFEGRLHQVGMGQIWIDTRLGRMSLESHRLATLETLEAMGEGQIGDRQGSRQIGQLTQVSVGVPGGLLTGTLLSRDGDDVTLRIATGLQVTVTSNDVRPLAGGSATLGVRPRDVDPQQ